MAALVRRETARGAERANDRMESIMVGMYGLCNGRVGDALLR